jgi:hypothetical protein
MRSLQEQYVIVILSDYTSGLRPVSQEADAQAFCCVLRSTSAAAMTKGCHCARGVDSSRGHHDPSMPHPFPFFGDKVHPSPVWDRLYRPTDHHDVFCNSTL